VSRITTTFSAHQASRDTSDPSIGVFSITKGSAAKVAVAQAGARPGGSPMHPVFAAKQGPASPQAATPNSLQEEPKHQQQSPSPPPTSAATAERHPPVGGPAGAAHADALAPADAARRHAALRESAGGTPSDAHPVPSQVQAGPPFYATGLPLDGPASAAAAALQRWALAGVGQQPSAAAAQQEASVPPSPARSTTSLRSPRSPPHPAIMLVGGREAASTASGVHGSVDGPAASQSYTAAAAQYPIAAPAAYNPLRTGDGKETLGTSRAQIGPAAAAPSVTAGEAPAGPPGRPRVSFQGLSWESQSLAVAHGEGGSAAGADQAPAVSSMSSSTGSLIQGTVGAGATVGAHRPSSIKSVRFSDHDPEEDLQQAPLRSRRESQEQQGLGGVGAAL
jgi:hypothetical protein